MSEEFHVTVENRKNTGTSPQWTKPIRGGILFNFAKNGTEKALNPDAETPMFATHITHNSERFQLSIGPDKNGIGPKEPIKAGQVVALNRQNPNEKIDISRWTVIADRLPDKKWS